MTFRPCGLRAAARSAIPALHSKELTITTRIVAAIALASVLFSFTAKADDSIKPNPSIPYLEDYTYFWELYRRSRPLQGGAMAKDDEVMADADARATAEACVTFAPKSLTVVTCK